MQTALYSFCLRLIRKFQTIFRDIYPRYPSRRNSASDRQLIGLMGISPYWEVSLSSHVSSPFRKAVPNFETSYLSLILSESWRMVSLAAEISYRPCDQRTCRVDILLSSYLELLFSLHLYRGRSLVFNNRFLL